MTVVFVHGNPKRGAEAIGTFLAEVSAG